MDTSFALKRTRFAILTVAVVGLPLVLFVVRQDSRPPTGKSVQEAEKRWELYEQRVQREKARARERVLQRRRLWHADIVDRDEQLVLRPTDAQSNEVARVFRQIAEAYQRESVADMRRCMSQCPDYLTNVVDNVYRELRRPCSSLFCDSFTHNDEMREFHGVPDFERYAETNVKMALFLGNLDLQRGAYADYLMLLESMVFKRLKDYKDRFHAEGKLELEQSADRYLKSWIDQIESPDGFTRRHMWLYADLQYPLVESGAMTREILHNRVALYMTRLFSDFGYTPKWVGEFSVITNTPLLPASSPPPNFEI